MEEVKKKYRIEFFKKMDMDGEEIIGKIECNHWQEDMLAGLYVIYCEGICNDDDCIIIPESCLRQVYQRYGLKDDKDIHKKKLKEKHKELIESKKAEPENKGIEGYY